MSSEIQEFANKYPSLDSIHLAIMDIARLSHTGKHGQRIRELLVKLINTENVQEKP